MSQLQQPIPTFESGYALRVDDLDNMFNYLDDNELHTRICLIGAGIFYGLEVAATTTEVTISAGAGVTSQGYLFCEKTDMKFGYLRPYNNKISPLLTNMNTWMKPFAAVPILPAEEGTLELMATLIANTETRAISQSDLNDRVVVIVFERTNDRRNGCTTCSKGINGNVVIRFLLVKKAVWDKVDKCPSSTTQTETMAVHFPYLERFGRASACANFFTYNESKTLNEQYGKVVEAAIKTLQPALTDMIERFAESFKRVKTTDSQTITNGLNWIMQNSISKQYSYDCVKHLIQAYTEFAESPFVQSTTQLPLETCFPKYLTLGHLKTPAVSQLPTLPNQKMDVFTEGVRLPFYRPPFADTSLVFEEAKFLYNRIISLLTAENLLFDRKSTRENEPNDIKITPSRSLLTPLSNRAIPYYFDGNKMRPNWHFNLSKTNRTQSIAAYDRAAGKPFNEPLWYQNAFDNADFYRVEGHIGSNLSTVWHKLVDQQDGLRSCLNLPFSIEIVELLADNANAKAVFTKLDDFAKKHTGLEHQGGVMRGGTLILVVERDQNVDKNPDIATIVLTPTQERALLFYKVVADFCLPYWVAEEPRRMALAYFTIENQEVNIGKPTRFINQSPKPQIFEWFINDKRALSLPNAQVDVDFNLTYIFDFDATDKTSAERVFVVTLVAKIDDNDKLPDMASQGVAITRTIDEKVEPPIADFELVSREPLLGDDNETPIGELITFENRSDHADSFKWSVVSKAETKVIFRTKSDDRDKLIAEFRFNQDVSYTVTLVANSKNGTSKAHLEVDVNQVIEKIDAPIADFAEINRRNTFNPDGTQKGIAIEYENRSDHADFFSWEIWVMSSNIEKELRGDKSRLFVGKTNFIVEFTFGELRQQTFKIKLIANPEQLDKGQTNFAIAEQIITFNQFVAFGVQPIEDVAPDAPPVDVVVNEGARGLETPTLDGFKAAQNMEARRRDFRKKIETEATNHPPLSKITSYKNVLKFIAEMDIAVADYDRVSSLGSGFPNLDSFDKTFKNNALQMIQNIKKAGGVPDDVYRTVLRNLLFYYLDKLVHLLPSELTPTTLNTVKEVLGKIKTEQSFATESLDDLRTSWQVEAITMVQNVPVVEELTGLFI